MRDETGQDGRQAWPHEWRHQWVLKRNCSLSPRQVARAYGALCLAAFGIGIVFALHGIWFVFLFCLIEIAGIALALLHYARHVCDHEHIALSARCLLVERIDGQCMHRVRLDPRSTNIVVPGRRRGLIRLESRGVTVEIGGLIAEQQRVQVAHEIRRALRAGSWLA